MSAQGSSVAKKAPRLPWNVYAYSFVAALASFVYGYNTGVIAPAILFIQKSLHPRPSVTEMSGIVSIVLLGAMVGSLFSGHLANRWGRVPLIIWNNVIMLSAAVGAAMTEHPVSMLISRFILGLGAGVASVVPSLYITEISPAHVRGKLGAINQFLGWTGVIVAYFTGYFIVDCGSGDFLCWRYMFASGGVMCIFHWILANAVLPESPRWLVSKNRGKEALHVLLSIYGHRHEELVVEQYQLACERKEYREPMLFKLKDFKKKRWGGPLFKSLMIQFIQQVSGNSAILYYTTVILHTLNFTEVDALLYNALASLPQLLVLFMLVFTLDRRGRRPALLLSQWGVFLSLVILGVATNVSDPTLRFWMLIGGIVSHRCFFAAGLGPLPGVVTPELLPFPIRGRGLSLALSINWLANFVVTATFPIFAHRYSPDRVYWGFAVLTLIGFVYALRSIPETKGQELDKVSGAFDHLDPPNAFQAESNAIYPPSPDVDQYDTDPSFAGSRSLSGSSSGSHQRASDDQQSSLMMAEESRPMTAAPIDVHSNGRIVRMSPSHGPHTAVADVDRSVASSSSSPGGARSISSALSPSSNVPLIADLWRPESDDDNDA